MAEVTLPDELVRNLDRVATDLSGFEGGDELAVYLLQEALVELERAEETTSLDEDVAEDVAEDVIEERLENLGYMG